MKYINKQSILKRARLLIIEVLLLMTNSLAFTQTITNPDFEIYSSCPNDYTQMSRATGWAQPTGGTCDYYNSCGFVHPLVLAQNGNGYAAGLAENGPNDSKEYITSTLSTPLVAGVTYTISYYVAQGYGSWVFNLVEMPVSERGFFGICFSTTAPTAANTTTGAGGSIRNTFAPTGRVYIPANNSYYTSRNTWMPITLQYTASGGEKYMTVGQFRQGTTSLPMWQANYFFVDNFSTSVMPNAKLTKSVSPASIPDGGTAIYTFTVTNTTTGNVALTGLNFTDTLPSGLRIAATANVIVTGLTGGSVSAAAGGTSVSASGYSIAANTTATITVNVTNVPGQLNLTCASNPAAFTNSAANLSNLSLNLTNSVTPVCLVVTCNAGSTAPPVTTSLGNVCPATTSNLNSAHTGTVPIGSSLVWFTNATHTGSAYASPATAATGTYYAFYYSSGANCYSPASTSVTVTNIICTPCPTAAPILNNTTAYSNALATYQIPCGSTTANLAALTASNMPASGSIITWHTDPVATAANRVNPSTVLAGTAKYYAAFYNASGNCYSPTKMITVLAPVCATDDDYTSTTIFAGVGGTLPSVFGNDTYNGTIIAAMPANSVDFNYEIWGDPNVITVDGNGNVTIPATLAAGNYEYAYSICDKDSDVAASSNCSFATIKFKVTAVFGCTNAMYLSQSNTLYTVSTATNPFTYPPTGTSTIIYNAIGLNPLDGNIYGMQTPTSTNLLRINTNGTSTNLGAVTGLPSATYNSGEIDNAGNYYVKANTSNNQLYRINLTTRIATLITLSASFITADIAYNVMTGLLYCVNSANGRLVTINPVTGAVAGIGIIPGVNVDFGAMYTSNNGEVFGINNNGGFYQFNLTTGERILISGAPASSANDGAHCVTAPITFSADLSVTKTNGVLKYSPGTNTTYTIVVKNNGPYGVLNAVVSDPVPMNIPSANVSYIAVASSGSTTTVSGTQTGVINDLVGLPVGGTVTYTVVVNIPIDFTGSLTNTATVTPPTNITDSDMTNNSATDTDTSNVCYKPGMSGTGLPVNHGISALGRAGANDKDNWPMVRQSAWTALEAKTKGFVVNRLSTLQISAIPASDLVEGMMVYNVTLNCLQINTTGTAAGWSCLKTQTCPN